MLNKIFLEVIIANGFDKKALKILKLKKNVRLIDSSKITFNDIWKFNSVDNFTLIQSEDRKIFSKKDFRIVSKRKPNKSQLDNLMFAFNVSRYTKSNAIVLANNKSTIGIGSGQPSRLDSCEIAINKMNKFSKIKNDIVAASDAFFPFVDGVEKLVQSGVSAIVQPAGSIRDKEIIKFANETNTVLIFSKTRHFRH
jgi:phosphoribosylaminoimidazolecarboxamide formyltransferase/IMP cyclohydrolase